jgi:hypothetical protein
MITLDFPRAVLVTDVNRFPTQLLPEIPGAKLTQVGTAQLITVQATRVPTGTWCHQVAVSIFVH